MAKKIKKKYSKGGVKLHGDVYYQCHIDFEYSEPDDGFCDFSIMHEAYMDEQLIFDTKLNWYGIPEDMKNEMLMLLGDAGVQDKTVTESKSFHHVLNEWTKLIKLLRKVNIARYAFTDAQKSDPNFAGEPQESFDVN